ncbi:MAG TPA: type I-E CRISPR-associated protein Cas5/CasD [Chthonomonadaceae bacterium]|nr:type I-E CRISPR-associated protein Cas5/CasD [Chthonomonadaceae bacterium]
MTARHTLLLRLVGPMQAWGYRSRFEDRDTGLEPTRSGVLGLLAAAGGIARSDRRTLAAWDEGLRFGVRVDLPRVGERVERTGFRVETDFHTAQDVLRASGKGTADTVLSHRHYLADARYTIGLESLDLALLEGLEAALKSPVWALSLGRRAFPLALPPWLPGGGIRQDTTLLAALMEAPFPLLRPVERLPERIAFAIQPDAEVAEAPPQHIPMRLADRPLDFGHGSRQFGLREAAHFRISAADCRMEADPCFSQS